MKTRDPRLDSTRELLPMKASGDTPEALSRALRALGRDGSDVARVARVAERLAATGIPSVAPAPGLLSRLFGSKAVLVGLSLGFGAASALAYLLIVDRPTPPAQRASKAVVAQAADAQAPELARASELAAASAAPTHDAALVATPEPAPTPPSARPPAEPPLAMQSSRPRPAPRGPVRKRDVESAPDTHQGLRAEVEHSVSRRVERASDSSSIAPVLPSSSPRPHEASSRQAPSRASNVDAPPPRVPPRVTEVGLLREARQLAASKPAAALRLLQQHAERFPTGKLVPERELLAIEVLRRLGREREAKLRRQRFEQRYPNSIYLQRLDRRSRD